MREVRVVPVRLCISYIFISSCDSKLSQNRSDNTHCEFTKRLHRAFDGLKSISRGGFDGNLHLYHYINAVPNITSDQFVEK